ncbi:hypothetical protein LWI29_019441 [Acer saccharum]|uniref:YqgF/RNase H-like domain-containing protein n=1 Tax=Acer saccharum TaxID=4024 RepID=A0AA39VZX0_ACESA|nr:hypothetical protein LWI29_019441 [Acer saccharum]
MKYLKPFDFYEEIFKDILIKKDLKPGRLLCLDVSDKYVSLAVSDWKNKTAVPLRALDRQENNLSSMLADTFQSLIPEHNIVGFVVGTKNTNPIDAQTLIFIDDLCKTGKFEGLKYTLWDCEITSKVSWVKAVGDNPLTIVVNKLANCAGIFQRWNTLGKKSAARCVAEKKKELADCREVVGGRR